MSGAYPRIDPHVHCRDWEQAYKATISSVMGLAASQGVSAVFDMPNTNPSITSLGLAKRRIETARQEGISGGYYLYLGVTGSAAQAAEAVSAHDSLPEVIGLKMFAGKSVGNLTVEESAQRAVYRSLAEIGYRGVLAVHCEKESLSMMRLWDQTDPKSWNAARPPVMEVEAVKEQILYAKEERFKGILHICHISVPEAVKAVHAARMEIRITCGATPHHLMLSTADMDGLEGLRYKVNPPLREPLMASRLFEMLHDGMIDWIETDHAPHSPAEKAFSELGEPMSGIPSLAGYAQFISNLQKSGFGEELIRSLTYLNIKRAFAKVTE